MAMTFLQKSDRKAARDYGWGAIEFVRNGNVKAAYYFSQLAAHYALRSMEWDA